VQKKLAPNAFAERTRLLKSMSVLIFLRCRY